MSLHRLKVGLMLMGAIALGALLCMEFADSSHASTVPLASAYYQLTVGDCPCGRDQSSTPNEACRRNATSCSGDAETCESNFGSEGCGPEDSANLGDGEGDYEVKTVNCGGEYFLLECAWNHVEETCTHGTLEGTVGPFSCGDKSIFQDCSGE